MKKVADLLGAARDTDVMIQHMEDLISHAPGEEKAGLQWFHQRLAVYRKQGQQELEGFLQDLDKDAFEHKITSCIAPGESSDG